MYAGDLIEATGCILSVGNTSRRCEFEAVPPLDMNDSAADSLNEPLVVARAIGTTIVKKDRQRR